MVIKQHTNVVYVTDSQLMFAAMSGESIYIDNYKRK